MFSNKNFLVISILSLAGLTACADLFTEAPADNEIFDGPIDGLTAVQLKGFADGDEAFGQTFNVETGLGPVFNQTACISCHPDDGRGHPSTNLTRFGKMLPDGSFDYMLEFGGPQLQDRSIHSNRTNNREVSTSPSSVAKVLALMITTTRCFWSSVCSA